MSLLDWVYEVGRKEISYSAAEYQMLMFCLFVFFLFVCFFTLLPLFPGW